MKIYLIYFTLLVFWIENSVGFELEQVLGFQQGVSLRNINLFILLVAWIIGFKKKSLFSFDKINLALFILCFIMIISIPIKMLIHDIEELNYTSELISFKHWINPWIFFFLLYNIIDDVELCKKSVRGLNILLIIVVGTVLIELYGNISLSAMKWGRSAGFAEANQFAAYLVLMLPLILTNFFLQKKITNKLSKGIFLFLTLLALISTVSRGGYIAFIACCLAFVALAYKNRMISGLRIFTFMIMTVAFVGTSYFVTPEKIKGIVQQRVEISQEKRFKDDEYAAEHSWLWKFSSGRSEIWLNCIKFFTESPIYGYGHEADKTILKIEPHNSFFIYLLNYGLIGFTFFIMMFYFIFKQIYSRFVSTTDDYSEKIYLAFLAGFIGYVVAMIGVDLYIPRYIFWIYAAIVCRYAILAPSGSINITKSAIT